MIYELCVPIAHRSSSFLAHFSKAVYALLLSLETVRRVRSKIPLKFKIAMFCPLFQKSEKMNIGPFEAEFKNKK